MRSFLTPILACFLLLGCSWSPKEVPPTTKPADPALAYQAAKEAFLSGAGDKTAYVAATVAYGTHVMRGPGAPNEKYPHALNLYKEALQLDPSNKEAKENRDLILSIYEQLGKKPPE